jgi:hypothetical protein
MTTIKGGGFGLLRFCICRKKVGQMSEMDAMELKKVWQESISLQF